MEVPKIFRYQFICSHEQIRLINLATSRVIDKQLPAECSNHLWFAAIDHNRKGTRSDHAEMIEYTKLLIIGQLFQMNWFM